MGGPGGTRVVSNPLKKPMAGVICEKLRINWSIVRHDNYGEKQWRREERGQFIYVKDYQSAIDNGQAMFQAIS